MSRKEVSFSLKDTPGARVAADGRVCRRSSTCEMSSCLKSRAAAAAEREIISSVKVKVSGRSREEMLFTIG